MSRSFLYHIFFLVLYVLCFTRPRYQVSVNRTIGPLVFLGSVNLLILFIYLYNLIIYHVYFFIYIYTFSQCLHPADARGTASYQIMEFEFAIMILLYIAKT